MKFQLPVNGRFLRHSSCREINEGRGGRKCGAAGMSAHSTVTSSGGVAVSAVTLSNMVTAPAVFVSGNTVVDLLVTDCSSIAQQPHS